MAKQVKTVKEVVKAVKQVVIIARYQFKNDPRKVCYGVRSSDGTAEYMTCLFDGKATSCSCPSRKPCKHMAQIELHEKERAARKENELLLVQIEAEVQAQIEEELAAAPVAKSEQARLAELPLSEDEQREVERFHAWQDELVDPWEGLDADERYAAWANYEMSMVGLAS